MHGLGGSLSWPCCAWKADLQPIWGEPSLLSGTTLVSCVALGKSPTLSELSFPFEQMGREVPNGHSELLSGVYTHAAGKLASAEQIPGIATKCL